MFDTTVEHVMRLHPNVDWVVDVNGEIRMVSSNFDLDHNVKDRIGFKLSKSYDETMEEVELEVGYAEPLDRIKTGSDGGSTSYYFLPEHATELRHLISYKSMSKARGDIFKACYRLGEKEGVDALYDLNKMKFFIEDLIEMYHRGEML